MNIGFTQCHKPTNWGWLKSHPYKWWLCGFPTWCCYIAIAFPPPEVFVIPLCARGLNWDALGMVRDGHKWGMVRPHLGIPLVTMDQEPWIWVQKMWYSAKLRGRKKQFLVRALVADFGHIPNGKSPMTGESIGNTLGKSTWCFIIRKFVIHLIWGWVKLPCTPSVHIKIAVPLWVLYVVPPI